MHTYGRQWDLAKFVVDVLSVHLEFPRLLICEQYTCSINMHQPWQTSLWYALIVSRLSCHLICAKSGTFDMAKRVQASASQIGWCNMQSESSLNGWWMDVPHHSLICCLYIPWWFQSSLILTDFKREPWFPGPIFTTKCLVNPETTCAGPFLTRLGDPTRWPWYQLVSPSWSNVLMCLYNVLWSALLKAH